MLSSLGAEFVGPSKRGIAGILYGMSFAVGLTSLSGIAYFIRHWRYLQIAITAPMIIFFFCAP